MKSRCITDRRLAENPELFGICGLRCGSGRLPCESPEHKSEGEFLDHPFSYKTDQKAEWGTSKDDELEGTVNPSPHKPHSSTRKTS
jgi:hypothetical protein